jgi:hypothetical protein
MQKARRHQTYNKLYLQLRLVVGIRFQVLFHSPSGVLFTFPSRYWYTIGHEIIFSLMPWSALIPTRLHVPRSTRVQKPRSPTNFTYRTITLYGSPFQDDSTINRISYSSNAPQRIPSLTHYTRCTTTVAFIHANRFRLFPFRSPLLRKSNSSFFSSGYLDVSLPQVRFPLITQENDPALPGPGCPIRISTDLRLLAPSRGFSQLATSFFAIPCLGIHRMPLLS